MKAAYWPLFGLRVVTPRLELRYADDEDLFALAQVAADGIHEPGVSPFLNTWSETGPEERARSVLQWAWRNRAELSAESWRLMLVVVVDGDVVGTQDINTSQFRILREGETGSWLGQRFQGRGIGTEMRAAVLHLFFAGLGGESAVTNAFEDNAPSLGVTRRLGYQPDGIVRIARNDKPATELRFRLGRGEWESRRRTDIEIHGLTDDVKRMLGAV